jgi:hydroxymethylpyrimidine pyrophosphatase-like HAD family hydrolase
MRYFALATDYDGTLATGGVVLDSTFRALERLTATGRKVVLVTGRQLDDLAQAFAHLDIFERVVAENGAVLFTPRTREVRLLDEPPPAAFVEELRRRGVAPVSVGKVIVATREPFQQVVLEAIRSMGLELHVEFNKGAVMVLPAGTTKRTGLAAALEDMHLSPHGVVGVGDAENDHTFLSLCECAVSVANALPSLKDRSDWVTLSPEGAGVVELIDRILADDLQSLAPHLARRRVPLGQLTSGEAVTFDAYDSCAVKIAPPRQMHQRHKRKYALGDVGPERSFFFRGPRGSLNLRAQNLALFVQMASGIDDDSWTFHLRAGDYSRWFRDAIKDDALAQEAEGVERDGGLSPAESRARVREAIETRYTLPA